LNGTASFAFETLADCPPGVHQFAAEVLLQAVDELLLGADTLELRLLEHDDRFVGVNRRGDLARLLDLRGHAARAEHGHGGNAGQRVPAAVSGARSARGTAVRCHAAIRFPTRLSIRQRCRRKRLTRS
jgi:hypothetical protein